jgi:hypothetical protein
MYDYLLLVSASWLGYRGAPLWAVALVVMLLAIPHFVRDQQDGSLSIATALSGISSLVFATTAFFVGRVIALVLV